MGPQSRKASNMLATQRVIMAEVPAAYAISFVLYDDSNINNDRITNVAAQTVAGQLSSPLQTGERIQVKVGADWLDAVSGAGLTYWTLPGVTLEEGMHQAQVRVLNALGDSGQVASFDYTLDTVAPPDPSAPFLASDTGESSSDRVTADNMPAFTGLGDSRYDVILFNGAGRELGRSAATGGQWSITPTYALANGVHTVSARSIDAAGNMSGLTPPTTVTIDTTAPTLAIGTDRASLKIGDSAVITFTFSERPGGSFDASDIKVSGGTLGPLTASGPGNVFYSATFTPAGGVDASTAHISVGAGTYTDTAGNAGGSAQVSGLTFDTLAPAAPTALDLDPGSDTGDSSSDNITGDTTPTFSGSAEAGSTVRLYADGQQVGIGVATGGAWRITSDALAAGTHQITAIATDAAGNPGPPSSSLAIQIVTGAPTTRVASIAISDDTGILSNDFITRAQNQVVNGTLTAPLAAGEMVKVSVDGGLNWVSAFIDSPITWSVFTELVEGEHTILAQVVNAIGTGGQAAVQNVTLDRVAPGVTIASDVSSLKSGETASITFTFTEAPGATFTAGDIGVDGGKLGALGGSGLVYTATFTPDAGVDGGSATISVAAGAFADLAGNTNTVGNLPSLTVDTLAPDAPPAPTLAATSDTGAVGDGITTSTSQVIEGGAEAGALVRLYDGASLLGSERADANGHWSITAALAIGAHRLRARQLDEAGNESVDSNPFALTVELASTPNPNPNPNPDPTPTPPTVIDGMRVTIAPVTLPGGVRGTSIAVPIVTEARQEASGAALLADIPLASSAGATLLLGQLPVGYGLSSNGAIVDAAAGLDLLTGMIRAATPGQAPEQLGHLLDAGGAFLAGAGHSALLVHTVRPVSAPAPSGALTLAGSKPAAGPGTAMVIETGGLAIGSKLNLVDIDFSAVIGAADVSIRGIGATVAGDGASQHFTVGAGSGSALFGGGGNDVLSVGPAAGASAMTTLHGGRGEDLVTFAGQRAEFDVVFHNGYTVVSGKAAPDVKALVVNVEQLQFSDGTMAVENDAALATLAGIYQTVLGRQADVDGFAFWADQRDAGASWGAIALAIIGSSEGQAGNGGFSGDSAGDLGLLYQALFERAADAAGLAFWQAAMEGGVTLEQVAGSFVESAEMIGHQRPAHDWDFSV